MCIRRANFFLFKSLFFALSLYVCKKKKIQKYNHNLLDRNRSENIYGKQFEFHENSTADRR